MVCQNIVCWTAVTKVSNVKHDRSMKQWRVECTFESSSNNACQWLYQCATTEHHEKIQHPYKNMWNQTESQEHNTPKKKKKNKNKIKERKVSDLSEVSHRHFTHCLECWQYFFFFSQQYKNTFGSLWSHALATFTPGLAIIIVQLPTLTWCQTQLRQQESWWVETRVHATQTEKEWFVSRGLGVNWRGVGKWSPCHLSGFCAGITTAEKLMASNTAAIQQQNVRTNKMWRLKARGWCCTRTCSFSHCIATCFT